MPDCLVSRCSFRPSLSRASISAFLREKSALNADIFSRSSGVRSTSEMRGTIMPPSAAVASTMAGYLCRSRRCEWHEGESQAWVVLKASNPGLGRCSQTGCTYPTVEPTYATCDVYAESNIL